MLSLLKEHNREALAIRRSLCDLTQTGALETLETSFSTLFHCARLPLLLPQLPSLKKVGVQRIVAFSTTNVLTKIDSTDPKERALVRAIATAEEKAMAFCEEQNIPLTIFRPTMIYGTGEDNSLGFITRCIQKFRFYPIVGKGEALRQPVHVDDCAKACLQAENNPRTFYKIYALSGGEVVSTRAMVARVFSSLGLKPRIISVSPSLLRAAIAGLRWLPSFGI